MIVPNLHWNTGSKTLVRTDVRTDVLTLHFAVFGSRENGAFMCCL